MPIKDYRIDKFYEEYKDKTLPQYIFILGDDVDQRFFIRKTLKRIFEKNHSISNPIESFIHETEGSSVTFRDLKNHGVHNGLFFDHKLIYLENFKKLNGFKKVKSKFLVQYLTSGDLENFLVLDNYSNTILDEIKELDLAGNTVVVIDSSTPDFKTKEAQSLIKFFSFLYLGFFPQVGFVDFLISKNGLNYLNSWKDLYTIDLFTESLDRETLDEVLYKTVISKKKNQGVDFFLASVLGSNKVAALNFLESFYKTEDKTIPLLYKLHDFFEKVFLIKRNITLSNYELSRKTYMSSKKIGVIKNLISRWEEKKIKHVIGQLASIDANYVKANFSKKIGKVLIEQLVIRNS